MSKGRYTPYSGGIRRIGKEGIKTIVEGSNLDDSGNYRPGLQAVAELGVKSPLRVCGSGVSGAFR